MNKTRGGALLPTVCSQSGASWSDSALTKPLFSVVASDVRRSTFPLRDTVAGTHSWEGGGAEFCSGFQRFRATIAGSKAGTPWWKGLEEESCSVPCRARALERKWQGPDVVPEPRPTPPRLTRQVDGHAWWWRVCGKPLEQGLRRTPDVPPAACRGQHRAMSQPDFLPEYPKARGYF